MVNWRLNWVRPHCCRHSEVIPHRSAPREIRLCPQRVVQRWWDTWAGSDTAGEQLSWARCWDWAALLLGRRLCYQRPSLPLGIQPCPVLYQPFTAGLGFSVFLILQERWLQSYAKTRVLYPVCIQKSQIQHTETRYCLLQSCAGLDAEIKAAYQKEK